MPKQERIFGRSSTTRAYPAHSNRLFVRRVTAPNVKYTLIGRRLKIQSGVVVKLKRRVFELYSSRYRNLTELARAMGMSVSQVYRVRRGKRPINEKFIIAAIKAFPEHKLDDLF